MEELLFEKATEDHLNSICDMYIEVIKDMRHNGIDQWDEQYPDKHCLLSDIEKGQLYIGIYKGQIASAFVINRECDEQYTNGTWTFPNTSFAVIHRLCVNPLFQHKGIGKATMSYIEEMTIKKGIQSIRLDTFTQNPKAVNLYLNLGYKKVGYAEWRKGRFILMEKQL